MSTMTNGHAAGPHIADHAFWRDHGTIVLSPFAAPYILGLFGFAAATSPCSPPHPPRWSSAPTCSSSAPIPGLRGSKHALTSTDLIHTSDLPEPLAILGGRYPGIEFAAIYARFARHAARDQGGRTPRRDLHPPSSTEAFNDVLATVVRTDEPHGSRT